MTGGDRLSDEAVHALAEKLVEDTITRSLAREVQALRSREREADALLRRCLEPVDWMTQAGDPSDVALLRDLRAFLKEG